MRNKKKSERDKIRDAIYHCIQAYLRSSDKKVEAYELYAIYDDLAKNPIDGVYDVDIAKNNSIKWLKIAADEGDGYSNWLLHLSGAADDTQYLKRAVKYGSIDAFKFYIDGGHGDTDEEYVEVLKRMLDSPELNEDDRLKYSKKLEDVYLFDLSHIYRFRDLKKAYQVHKYGRLPESHDIDEMSIDDARNILRYLINFTDLKTSCLLGDFYQYWLYNKYIEDEETRPLIFHISAKCNYDWEYLALQKVEDFKFEEKWQIVQDVTRLSSLKSIIDPTYLIIFEQLQDYKFELLQSAQSALPVDIAMIIFGYLPWFDGLILPPIYNKALSLMKENLMLGRIFSTAS